jgi:hypothetical protein
MKTTIAIQSNRPGLADAITAHLARLHPRTKLVTVSKIGDVEPGTQLAGLGMPQFFTGTSPVVYHNVGRKWDKNDTQEQRDAQYEVLRNPDATMQEILPQLGWVEEMLVFPGKAYAEAKALVSEARLNIAEAETDAEKLKAYKEGFETLRDIFLAKAAPAPEPATEEAPAETESADIPL